SSDVCSSDLTVLPGHPNGMVLAARDPAGEVSYEQTYYSTGGGFVATADELGSRGELPSAPPGPFRTAAELLRRCAETGSAVSDVMLRFEATRRPAAQVREYLLRIRDVMWECVRRGVHAEGELPGGLGVRRRHADSYRRPSLEGPGPRDPALAAHWVDRVTLAVHEAS